jgi:predicted transcriptional regulator
MIYDIILTHEQHQEVPIMEAIDIKTQAHEAIDKLPENCSWEDVQYHLYAVEKIQKGLKCVEEGRTVSHEEVKKRLGKWLDS